MSLYCEQRHEIKSVALLSAAGNTNDTSITRLNNKRSIRNSINLLRMHLFLSGSWEINVRITPLWVRVQNIDHATAPKFKLVVRDHLQLSRSVATPPATASLSSAAPRRPCGGAGCSIDKSFTSGVSNPHHRRIYDERRGPVTLTRCGFAIPSQKKEKRKNGNSGTGSALTLSSEQRPNTGSLVEPRHLFSGPDAAEVVNLALNHRQTGSELRNNTKMTKQTRFQRGCRPSPTHTNAFINP